MRFWRYSVFIFFFLLYFFISFLSLFTGILFFSLLFSSPFLLFYFLFSLFYPFLFLILLICSKYFLPSLFFSFSCFSFFFFPFLFLLLLPSYIYICIYSSSSSFLSLLMKDYFVCWEEIPHWVDNLAQMTPMIQYRKNMIAGSWYVCQSKCAPALHTFFHFLHNFSNTLRMRKPCCHCWRHYHCISKVLNGIVNRPHQNAVVMLLSCREYYRWSGVCRLEQPKRDARSMSDQIANQPTKVQLD